MSVTTDFFNALVKSAKDKKAMAICSVCSSSRFVIEAALEEGLNQDKPVLVESTANQVNQFGGYSGMLPADFADYVYTLADKAGFPKERLILGGDHLGPLVWSAENEESAMKKAVDLVAAYAAAGFEKIHLDCSMRLGSDDKKAPLAPRTVAKRAALLCEAAEKNSPVKPVYVIGSEVPIPGGATEKEEALSVTDPEALLEEYDAFKDAFNAAGLKDAWERVTAIVVQPGVEFGDEQIFLYDGKKAENLTKTARSIPGIVLEGHSTDYQSAECLSAMKRDGIAILKVGPALTFAVREALFALENIEKVLCRRQKGSCLSNFAGVLEEEMLKAPENWAKHYFGDEEALYLKRKYSLSDRSRYYFDKKRVADSVEKLIHNINSVRIPMGLLKQFLPRQAEQAAAGALSADAETLIKEHVKYVLRTYER